MGEGGLGPCSQPCIVPQMQLVTGQPCCPSFCSVLGQKVVSACLQCLACIVLAASWLSMHAQVLSGCMQGHITHDQNLTALFVQDCTMLQTKFTQLYTHGTALPVS